jgi:sortase (surface protein transpeptidase)
VENGGLSASWRAVITVAAVLLGGGGTWTAIDFASKEYVDESIEANTAKIIDAEDAKMDEIDKSVQKNSTELKQHGRVIGEVRIDIGEIQKVQHQQYARDEARRVTSSIKNRSLREQTYDRLVDLNLARLRNDKAPCANFDCSN